jgi:hypothetical protein
VKAGTIESLELRHQTVLRRFCRVSKYVDFWHHAGLKHRRVPQKPLIPDPPVPVEARNHDGFPDF